MKTQHPSTSPKDSLTSDLMVALRDAHTWNHMLDDLSQRLPEVSEEITGCLQALQAELPEGQVAPDTQRQALQVMGRLAELMAIIHRASAGLNSVVWARPLCWETKPAAP